MFQCFLLWSLKQLILVSVLEARSNLEQLILANYLCSCCTFLLKFKLCNKFFDYGSLSTVSITAFASNTSFRSWAYKFFCISIPLLQNFCPIQSLASDTLWAEWWFYPLHGPIYKSGTDMELGSVFHYHASWFNFHTIN